MSLMRAGAHDYVLKSHLDSLAQVVAREVYEASNRKARQLADQLLKNSDQYYKAIVESTTDEVMRYDQSGRHLYGNSVALAALGLSLAQYVGKTDRDLGRPEHLCRLLENKLLSVFKTGESQVVEYDTVTAQGKQTFELRLFPEFSSDNVVMSVVGITRDMTEKIRAMEVILQQASFDSLTGLANRRSFCQHVEEQIKRSRRDGMSIALLLINLDHFKQVNDQVGRALGDQMLTSIARRLSLCIREIDILGRLGGDEFAILLTGMHNLQNVGRVTEMILASLAGEFHIQQEKIRISASIGVACCPDDASDLRELLHCADHALSLAKASGNAQYYYSQDIGASSVTTSASTTSAAAISDEGLQLQQALREQQFKLYYQP